MSKNNKAGNTPEDIIIWRYHDLPKYMDLLIREQLFFNKVDKFEDPFERIQGKDVSSSPAANAAVNTWHMNNEESYAMWRIYGQGIYGLAIQTTLHKLKQSFQKTNLQIEIREVDYVSDDVLQDRKTSPYFTKRKIYAFENELRCCVILNEEAPQWDTQGAYNGIFVDVNLKTLIERVYISPYSPTWFRDLVARINKRFDIDVEIRHSVVFEVPATGIMID